MSRLSFTFIFLFFLFFTFSSARIPLNSPEREIINLDDANSLPESSNKPEILLPTKKDESDPATIEIEPEISHTDIRSTDAEHQIQSEEDFPVLSDSFSVQTFHLKSPNYIRIHPINRRFRLKQPLVIRFHDCHHHHHHMNQGLRGRQVPYGGDMILAGKRNDFDTKVFRGDKSRTPEAWGNIRHHHHDEDDEKTLSYPVRNYMFAKHKFKRALERKEKEKRKKRKERNEEGFFSRLRKFLNSF